MINLIPASARRMIVREYWVRTMAVWMFLLGTGCLVVASLFLPTYVLVSKQVDDLQIQVDQNAASTATFDSSAAALTTAMKQATFLLASSTPVTFTMYKKMITAIAGEGVDISGFQFVRVGSTTAITLDGMASTRQALATFRDDLEREPLLTTVVLPISNLIKDRDIVFTMTVTGIATSTTP